jgi:hypothetical protein
MAVGPGELIDLVAVPIEPEPTHPVEDRLDRRLGRARAVGILDAEQELAAMMPREEQVEQRGARAANVEIAGRRRREPGNDVAVGCASGRSGIRTCAQPRVLPS